MILENLMLLPIESGDFSRIDRRDWRKVKCSRQNRIFSGGKSRKSQKHDYWVLHGDEKHLEDKKISKAE